LAAAPSTTAAGAVSTIVGFLAYSDDCLLIGRLRLPSGRLTDLLNEQEAFEVLDVSAERLRDGYVASAPALLVERRELLLVQVAGPRGDPAHRRRTRAFPIAAQVGPYRVRGLLHAGQGQDPVAAIRHGQPMVPLTDAWIERPVGDDRDVQSIGTVALNRDHVDWAVETWDDSSRWLAMDLIAPAIDRSGPAADPPEP
jgi:hypothetical protein